MENVDSGDSLHYLVKLKNKTLKYDFVSENGHLKLKLENDFSDTNWVKLEVNQCPHCTLDKSKHPICPIANNLAQLVIDWDDVISFDEAELTVESKQRNVFAHTTAQKILSSLFGLIMATSDCPNTQFFRPMAQFHLPLSSNEETTFRAVSTFLLTQFFRQQNGEDAEFDLAGLSIIYENMHELNVWMKKRINDAVKNDAALNAFAILDILTITSSNFLDDELERLKPFFSILIKN